MYKSRARKSLNRRQRTPTRSKRQQRTYTNRSIQYKRLAPTVRASPRLSARVGLVPKPSNRRNPSTRRRYALIGPRSYDAGIMLGLLGAAGLGTSGLWWYMQGPKKGNIIRRNNKTLEEVPNAGGGNCLLYSISDGLREYCKVQLDIKSLRELLVKSLRTNRRQPYVGGQTLEQAYMDLYVPIMQRERGVNNASYEQIVDFISRDGTWLNDIDATVLARALNVCMQVHSDEGYSFELNLDCPGTTCNSPIDILHSGGNHFTFLKKSSVV
jgi:hypothetical protein